MGAMISSMADSVDVVLDYAVAARPLSGQTESGDSHAVIRQRHGLLIAVADGLGHGYEAGLAAKLAVITLTAQAHLPLLNLVKCCHDALLRTRGVAMGIACLECGGQTMTWLSVGNVAGLLLRANDTGLEREHILMRNGVIGHRLPPLRTATLGLRPGDTLVFATDGIREGFQSDVRPGAHLQETADRILARYGKVTDDALVLVGRWRGCPKYSSHVDLPPNGGDER
jgi:negative regulator of sigma-B (phosphoserine phosphatase)